MTKIELPQLPVPMGLIQYPGGAYEPAWVGFSDAYGEDQMRDYAEQSIKMELAKRGIA